MKDELLKSFGTNLKTIRKEKGLSQMDLATKGGFDRNYIGMIERGERNPSLLNLKRIADALELPLVTLLTF